MATYTAWWNADGLAAGSALTNVLIGSGDNHFDTVSITAPNTVKTKAGGLYTPRLECLPSTGANMYWLWQASLGSFTNHAVTFYFEIAALPTPTSFQIFSMRTTANEQLYWLDINVAGLVRLRNNAGTAIMTSLQPIPLNQVIRFDMLYTHSTGEVWAFMSYGEDYRRFEYMHGTGFNLNSTGGALVPAQCRFGSNTVVSQGAAHCYYDDMIFGTGDVSTTLGPINGDDTSGLYVWNGTAEVPISSMAKWTGTDEDYSPIVEIKR